MSIRVNSFKASVCAAATMLCLLGGMLSARAEAPDACRASGTPARVAAVLDDLELALDDGRTLRLAGIDPARATPTRPGLGEDARQALMGWLAGRAVTVRALSAAPDRWGRIPALVFATASATKDSTAATDPALSVAEALLDAGWARAKPEPEVHPCFPFFLAAEASARAAGLGLWADPYYAVLDADDRNGLAVRVGAMVLVEGRFHIRNGRRRLFVTLGRASSGFLATLATRTAKALGRAGLDLQELGGKKVRIRGFLDDRFGLRMDLVSGDQIEALERASAEGAPAPATAGQQSGQ